ncbi:MAG: PUR family DNA/RNA-binding protein [Tannerella sp.]|nr:PUR family DNA/RNA-binding protein [Tannerella sp.]
MKNKQNESEKDIIYSKTLKAGKRIYYLDVKKNLRNDLFVVITESKRNYSENQTNVTYEKHKIFLYKEDFEKFMNGMNDVIRFISDSTESITDETELSEDENPEEDNL